MDVRIARAVWSIALLGAFACSGSTEATSTVARTTVPSPPSSSAPGPVTYTAQTFMKGMTVTVPSEDWTVFEDHPGEFNIAAPSSTPANIHFLLDPYPSLKDDKPLQGVGRTAPALIDWLSGDPNFNMSDRSTVKMADGTSATTFLLDLTGDCIDYFVFQTAAYDFPYGTCPGNPPRLYIETLGDGAKAHTFVIAVDAKNKKTFESIIPAASKIVTNASLPAKVSAG